MVIVFGLLYGQNMTSASLVSNLLDPFGFTGSEASFYMLPMLFSGLIGSIVIGMFIDKTNKYKCALQTVTLMLAISCSVAVFSL